MDNLDAMYESSVRQLEMIQKYFIKFQNSSEFESNDNETAKNVIRNFVDHNVKLRKLISVSDISDNHKKVVIEGVRELVTHIMSSLGDSE